MSITRPFAYNTGTTIGGTDQLGNIAIGITSQQYSLDIGNVDWWMGPDEDLGYVITHTTSGGTQPNPVGGSAYIGFWRSKLLTEQSFLDLSNVIPPRKGQLPFNNAADAKIWLNNNGYWTSYEYVLPTPTPTSISITPTPTVTTTNTPTVTVTTTNTPTLTNTPSSTTTQALLLDSYPNSKFAFSLRKLSSTYGGSAIRVRRNSDNTEQDIGFVSNQLDTTALQSFVGSTNLLSYSENFSVWATNLSATINSDVTTDPIGGNTADRLNFGSSANSEVYLQPITWQSTTYNVSIYAKSDSTNKFRVKIWNGVTATFSSDITTTSTWTRYDVSLTVNSGVGNFGISNISAGGAGSIFIWGAQISPISLQPYRQTAGGAATTYGYITRWYDQSGNGIVAAQTTAGLQPRIVNTGNIETQGGKPSMLFVTSSNNSLVTTTNVATNSYMSTFIVSKMDETTSTYKFITTIGSNIVGPDFYAIVLRAGSNFYNWKTGDSLVWGSGASIGLTPAINTSGNVYNNIYALTSTFIGSANTSYYVNNVEATYRERTQGNVSTNNTGTPLIIGTRLTNQEVYDGYLSELVIYGSNQFSNRSGIQTNINSFYTIY
jgi:hypothetical protein